ncbi:hypothetical protein M8494_16380 [Serratia ureilytica]
MLATRPDGFSRYLLALSLVVALRAWTGSGQPYAACYGGKSASYHWRVDMLDVGHGSGGDRQAGILYDTGDRWAA